MADHYVEEDELERQPGRGDARDRIWKRLGSPVPEQLWHRYDVMNIETQRFLLLLPLVKAYRELIWWSNSELLSPRLRKRLTHRLGSIAMLVAVDRDVALMEAQEPEVMDWEQWKSGIAATALASLTTWSGQTHEWGLNFISGAAQKSTNETMTKKTTLFDRFEREYRTLP